MSVFEGCKSRSEITFVRNEKICPITGEHVCKCKRDIQPIFEVSPRDTLRKLFEDHGVFIHLYIQAEINDLPNTEASFKRLCQNQIDIGAAISKIYNETIGDNFVKVLTKHIKTASAVVNAAISVKYSEDDREEEENKAMLKEAEERFYENGEAVAQVISNLKPKEFTYKAMLKHFDEHLDYIISITELYLDERYNEALKEYDCYINHLLYFADLLVL